MGTGLSWKRPNEQGDGKAIGPRLNNIMFRCYCQTVHQFAHLGQQNCRHVTHARRPPFQGALRCAQFPGLKPWAMMYSRFAAKAMHAKAIALFDVYLAPNNFLTAALCAA
jgi:hypothetical protein